MDIRRGRILDFCQHVYFAVFPANSKYLVRWESTAEFTRIIVEITRLFISAGMGSRKRTIKPRIELLVRGCDEWLEGFGVYDLKHVCVGFSNNVTCTRRCRKTR